MSLDHYISLTLDHYLRTRSANSAHTYRSHADLLSRTWGHLRPDQLTARQIEAWIGDGDRRPATVRHILSWLSAVWDTAEADGVEVPCPVRRVRAPKVHNQRTRWLTEEEEIALRPEMGGEWRTARFAILTGLRRLEQFSLTTSEIDVEDACLWFQGSKGTKFRRVPLNDEACHILARVVQERRGARYLFGSQHPNRVYVGNLYSNSVFNPAVKRAGLDGVTWHTLRHTFGTRLARQGIHHRVIQALMGHASIAMTERYLHVDGDQLRQAVGRLR